MTHDDYITGRYDTDHPGSPAYIEKRTEETIILQEGLSRCPGCCEFFDPSGTINEGKIIDPKKEYGVQPQWWTDDKCPECKKYDEWT